MYFNNNWALVVPMANEENDFFPYITILKEVLDKLGSGTVYLVVDRVSIDNTLQLCQELSKNDERFTTVWAPDTKSIVDAYLAGYKAAYDNGHTFIIEMDAGLSHDPRALPMFLRVLNEGIECAFGSRFIDGGSIADSEWKRWFLSKFGTVLSNIMLGTKLKDMTSGYQGFHRNVVKQFLNYPLKSTAHFYQTELKYLLRNKRYMEIPIHYRAPSPSVSPKAIRNARKTLFYYFRQRIKGNNNYL
jgi:dolichol-phosphate mannosyltransferase